MSKVYVDNGYINIEGYYYYLSVNFEGVYGLMNLSDFGKMIKVVGGVLDPHDYYEYLHHWYNWLDEQLPAAHNMDLARIHKMMARINKALDKLPMWVIEDAHD